MQKSAIAVLCSVVLAVMVPPLSAQPPKAPGGPPSAVKPSKPGLEARAELERTAKQLLKELPQKTHPKLVKPVKELRGNLESLTHATRLTDNQLRKIGADVRRIQGEIKQQTGAIVAAIGDKRTTADCLQDCETEFTRCMQRGGDDSWLIEIACRGRAVVCSSGCVVNP